MRRSARFETGFTLLEIMLVVSIIALLAAAAIFKLSGNLQVAQITRVEGDLQSFKAQLNTYQGMAGSLPTSDQGLKALVDPPSPRPRRWVKLLNEVPVDPWGKEYVYKRPATRSKDAYDLYSTGPTGPEKEDPSDDIGNW
ncbi:MAG: type II secretion system protein GspG [Verrucomicrobiaceae bacterium]|nr:MAG: type II secretion system protein GspG [Verrucomicrobiaceae bacterium]